MFCVSSSERHFLHTWDGDSSTASSWHLGKNCALFVESPLRGNRTLHTVMSVIHAFIPPVYNSVAKTGVL